MKRFTAHQYQKDAARFLLKNPFSALYADPGTGKTAILLMVLTMLKKAGKLPPVLVTAPLRIATVTWPDEIAKWEQFSGLTFSVIHGSKEKRWKALNTEADIYLINNEGLPWLDKVCGFVKFDKGILIIDETSKFKNWSSGRTKILKRMMKVFSRRHGLTGSPAPRSLLDLFSQQYLCDGGRAFGPYITRYREKYFDDKGWDWPDWQLKEGAEDAIYEAVAPYCYRLDASVLLDLPELLTHDIEIELPTKIRKMSFEALGEIGDSIGLSAAAEYAAARQIAGGFTASGQKIHDYKISAMRDLLDELQGKNALCFFYYRAEGKALSEAFGAPRIDGGTSAFESGKLMRQWNAGELPLLLLHPAATGHGLNLQSGGNDIIWYSYTDNQDDYYQANRRVWRQGVEGTVRMHRLIAKDTIDEAMLISLAMKTNQQQALLDAVRELQSRRV